MAAAAIMPTTAFGDFNFEKSLSFFNIHTNENLEVTFWRNGHYDQNALKNINYFLRDYRSNTWIDIDKNLLELLYSLKEILGTSEAFHVISGYRSPETNELLHKRSSGVAKKSLHMEGKAIDIRIPKCELSNLCKTAINLKLGGVGYYPESNFVHVDVGHIRKW